MDEEEVIGKEDGCGDKKPTDTETGHRDKQDGEDQGDDATGEKPEESSVDDEPEGFRKSIRKGIKTAKKVLTCSLVREKGDNTEAEAPYQPASEYDGDEYDFTHQKRGRAIIINNEKFMDMGHRGGSVYDKNSLEEMFKKLDFDVKCYDDCTALQMKCVLEKEARDYDHKNADCLAVAILSHGDQEMYKYLPKKEEHRHVRRDIVYGVDGNCLSTGSVVRTFQDSRCPGLKGKPRLFFLQACRGEGLDPGQDVAVVTDKPDSTDTASMQPKELSPTGANIPSSSDTATDVGSFDQKDEPDKKSTEQVAVGSFGEQDRDGKETEPKEHDHFDTSSPKADTQSLELEDSGISSPTSITTPGAISQISSDEIDVERKPVPDADGQTAPAAEGQLAPEAVGQPLPDTVGHVTTEVEGQVEVEHDDDELDARRREWFVIYPTPIFKDFMIMYATPPGYFAWRRTSGSWFVQSLHSVFTKDYEPSMSLNQALTKVTRMVAQGYEAQSTQNTSHAGKKQTPVIQSMLIKDIYFTK